MHSPLYLFLFKRSKQEQCQPRWYLLPESSCLIAVFACIIIEIVGEWESDYLYGSYETFGGLSLETLIINILTRNIAEPRH